MASRGPQHRARVEVWNDAGRVATATCFFSTFEGDAGERRWRGFLADLEPAGTVAVGRYELAPDSGRRATIEVTEVRAEPREQAIFRGLDSPLSTGGSD